MTEHNESVSNGEIESLTSVSCAGHIVIVTGTTNTNNDADINVGKQHFQSLIEYGKSTGN